jgi:hypothetical protein
MLEEKRSNSRKREQACWIVSDTVITKTPYWNAPLYPYTAMKCSKITSTTALLDSYLTLQLLFRSVCSVSASTDPSYQPVYSSPPPDETNPRDDGKLGSLFKSYVDLPPLGKFITGIFVGFIVTRIIMRSALRLLKLLVAVFIV